MGLPVSVVIPTYNQASLLRQALASVVGQTFVDWEAVIINNFSDDDTVSVVKSFADPRLKITNLRNHGIIAASRNKGIEMARGEWVAFLDSDDLWRPEKLQRCMAAVESGIDLISHRESTFRGERTLAVSPHFRPADASYRNLLFNRTCFSPSATLVRRRLLDEVGGFSEKPALVTVEDYDLWLRLIDAGARVRFIDAVLSDYRLHESNTSAGVLRHMEAGLHAVESHYRNMSSNKPLDWLWHRRRRAMIIYGAGRSFQKTARRRDARRCFVGSLMNYPLNFRALGCALMTLFPRSSEREHG